jgi:uncharacterized protein DUF3955
MAVIALGLFALAAFASLVAAAERGSRIGRAGALVEAAALIPLSAFALFAALIYLSLGCDDHCSDPSAPGSHWWDSTHAWQWWAQFAVCSLGVLAVVGAFAAAKRARYRRSIVLMGVAAAAFAVWGALLAPLGNAFGL